MTHGNVVRADLRRHVQVCQGIFRGIEWRTEIVVVYSHEEMHAGVTRQSAGQARVVVSGGGEGADAAIHEVEDSVAVSVEGKLAPQVLLIGDLETSGEIAQ